MGRRIEELKEMGLGALQQSFGRAGERYPLRTLFWECTLQCNQLCKHCGSRASAKPSDDITGDEFLEVLAILRTRLAQRRLPLPFLAITGGEPLVRSDLLEVMSEASHTLGYRWGLTTNGLLLSETTIARLKAADMRTASISLDGFGATHDLLRASPGSFETVVANIQSLLAANFAKEVQVTTVVNPLNIDDLEQLHELLLSFASSGATEETEAAATGTMEADVASRAPRSGGLGSWRLATCDPIGRAETDETLMLNAEQTRRVLEFIVHNDSVRLPIKYACPSHLGAYELRARKQAFSCFAGKSVMSILHDGALASCPNIPRNATTIQGSVRDPALKKDLYRVWVQGYTFHRDPSARYSEFCQACADWPACGGGSLHTFDFEKGCQRTCIQKMLR